MIGSRRSGLYIGSSLPARGDEKRPLCCLSNPPSNTHVRNPSCSSPITTWETPGNIYKGTPRTTRLHGVMAQQGTHLVSPLGTRTPESSVVPAEFNISPIS